ncbi:MAG: phosphopantothenoylcysteine decarboxylase [Oscillospiraceae bacterium]|jgi:phosphopantothenoylcysteine decarboxylase|nr:phosphopantothenoylcysteine decarboxylase [Oscillospiraceae bacterium]
MPNILLGVTGSIAAYKAAELASGLVKAGHSVHVVMTQSACAFVTPLTFQTLTRNKVHTHMFERLNEVQVEHVSLAQTADLAIVAPATANSIAKLAQGIADDMLSTVLLAYPPQKPLLLAPAMNTAMLEHPATQANLRLLQQRGVCILAPRSSRLACGDVGRGAMAEVEQILTGIAEALA